MQTVFYAVKCSLLSLDKFKATEFDWLRGCLEFYGPFLGEVQKKPVQFGFFDRFENAMPAFGKRLSANFTVP